MYVRIAFIRLIITGFRPPRLFIYVTAIMLYESNCTTFPCTGCLKDCRDLRTTSNSLKSDGQYATFLVHLPDASNICVVPPHHVPDTSMSSCTSIAFLHWGVLFQKANASLKHKRSVLHFLSISRSYSHVDLEDNV